MSTTQTTTTPLVTLTDAAVAEVKRLMDVQDLTEGGLRLGVKGGGCSGLSYTINFDDKIGEFDTVCGTGRCEGHCGCHRAPFIS